MKIDEIDWSAFVRHLNATLDAFKVPQAERDAVVAFIRARRRTSSKHRRWYERSREKEIRCSSGKCKSSAAISPRMCARCWSSWT